MMSSFQRSQKKPKAKPAKGRSLLFSFFVVGGFLCCPLFVFLGGGCFCLFALGGGSEEREPRHENKKTPCFPVSLTRRDFLCSLEMVLEHELSKDSALNLQVAAWIRF